MLKDPWFGPRRGGWGWTPLRPIGWLIAVVGIAGVIVCAAVLSGAAKAVGIAGVLVAVGATCWITGGPPGRVR
jgi:peptidoglycan/LPS O-acetylase OafA/YrhL